MHLCLLRGWYLEIQIEALPHLLVFVVVVFLGALFGQGNTERNPAPLPVSHSQGRGRRAPRFEAAAGRMGFEPAVAEQIYAALDLKAMGKIFEEAPGGGGQHGRGEPGSLVLENPFCSLLPFFFCGVLFVWVLLCLFLCFVGLLACLPA